MKKSISSRGALLVIVAAALWGSLGVFVRHLGEFTTVEIIFLRSIFTVLILGAYGLAARREMLRIRLKDLWCFLGTGILSLLFFNFCYYKSIAYTSMSVAAVLMYTAPCFVMILSAVLFHEKISQKNVLSLILAFAGCVCVSGILGGSQQLGWHGILLGLGSGFGYALYSIFSRYALNRGYQSVTISFYTFVFAAAGAAPFIKWGHFTGMIAARPSTIGISVAFAFFTTVLAYVCYTSGLKTMDNSRASIIACVEPAVATLLGFLLYGEILDLWSWLGLILVLGSTILVNIRFTTKKEKILQER